MFLGKNVHPGSELTKSLSSVCLGVVGRVKSQVNIFGIFLPDVNDFSFSFSERTMNYRLF